MKKKGFFVCYKNISHMFVLPSHCRTLITWGHFIGFFQTPYLQFMLGDGVSLKRLVSLQTCVTWTTRTRRAIPQSCWQPSPLWKQRRTCGLWKNSSAVGTWMPKPARWARTLALFPKFMFMLANSALTCTGFPHYTSYHWALTHWPSPKFIWLPGSPRWPNTLTKYWLKPHTGNFSVHCLTPGGVHRNCRAARL